jgi:thymidylate kinase
MDEQSLEFHRRVWRAYHDLAAREPERVKVVDGRAPADVIEREIWGIVEPHV